MEVLQMARIKINQTPEFESNLMRLMKLRNLRSKSEAIRLAVKEALERALEQSQAAAYSDWIGIACGGQDGLQRFKNHSDVWT